MHLADPTFPPLLSGHPVKMPERPLTVACARAASGALGAGDVVWARNTRIAEAAVVLEPDVSASRARDMRIVLQIALVDAVGALMPSQTALQIVWPDTVLCNGAKVGETVLAGPDDGDDEIPSWLVAGYRLRLARDLEGLEPGEVRDESSLQEEDGGELDRSQIIASVSAHFLNAIHDWEHDGLRPMIDRWIGRVIGYEAPAEFDLPEPGGKVVQRVARVLGVSDEAGLIVRDVETGKTHVLPSTQAEWPKHLPPAFAA